MEFIFWNNSTFTCKRCFFLLTPTPLYSGASHLHRVPKMAQHVILRRQIGIIKITLKQEKSDAFSAWHPYMWWPLKSFVIISCETAKNTNICFIYAATGEVSQLSTQARQKWQLSCWGSSAQKRWLLPQPIWKWATKKRLATTSVYYVTRGGRNEAKSLLWTTPNWPGSEGHTVGIAMVGESKLAKHRNWSKKFLLSKSVKLSTHDSKNKQTSCSNPTAIQVTRPRPNSGGGRQHRQIPVYTWLVVVDDDEFLRVVIRLKR